MGVWACTVSHTVLPGMCKFRLGQLNGKQTGNAAAAEKREKKRLQRARRRKAVQRGAGKPCRKDVLIEEPDDLSSYIHELRLRADC